MALEQSPADPRKNCHAQSISEIQHPSIHGVGGLSLGDRLDEEGHEGIQRVLVHVVDEAPVSTPR